MHLSCVSINYMLLIVIPWHMIDDKKYNGITVTTLMPNSPLTADRR